MKKLFILMASVFSVISFAQSGLIRGTLADKESEKSISVTTIELLNTGENRAIADENGNFKLINIPLRRQTIRISLLGYESTTVLDIDVTSGKEVIINVSLIESFDELEEVIIKA